MGYWTAFEYNLLKVKNIQKKYYPEKVGLRVDLKKLLFR
jgi:hypothetical protein